MSADIIAFPLARTSAPTAEEFALRPIPCTIGSLPGWGRALARGLVRSFGAERARAWLEEEIAALN
jgi:hypothetical protein